MLVEEKRYCMQIDCLEEQYKVVMIFDTALKSTTLYRLES